MAASPSGHVPPNYSLQRTVSDKVPIVRRHRAAAERER